MADDRRTTPANQAEVGSRFDTGWWRAARLGGLLAVMAALAYAAGQYSVGRTSSATATAPINQPPANEGYGVGGDTAPGGGR